MFRFAVLSILFGIAAIAVEPKMIKFPKEVAAIFSSADYVRALKDASDKLPEGFEIAVIGASYQEIGDKTYAYVHLEKQRAMFFPVVGFPYGNLVGEVSYNPESGAAVKGVSFSPVPEPAEDKVKINCQSIDVTFRPYYKVKISLFDPTHDNYYLVQIHKTIDLEGKKKESFNKEGKGKITKTGFFVDFEDGGKIQGKRLPNGVLKAELRLRGERPEELSCKP